MSNVPLSGQRLWDSLMEMAQIGGTAKGGNNRQTLTDLDSDGRHLLRRWAEAAGCTMAVDRVGNMTLTRPGRDASRKSVAFGSHLDTQPTGGKFDGVLGVLAGLEILRAVHEAGIETEAPAHAHQLDQRGRRALRPADDGQRGGDGHLHRGRGAGEAGPGRSGLRRGTGAHRLAG
jgi:hypothetical protein